MSERPPSDLVQKNLPCPDIAGEYHTTHGGGEMSGALYDDGHMHCFSCKGTWGVTTLKAMGVDTGVTSTSDMIRKQAGEPPASVELERDLAKGKAQAITSRKLTAQTCKRWGYVVRLSSKHHVQELMPVRAPNGSLVGIKVRDKGVDKLGKDFFAMGTVKGHLIGRDRHGPGQKRTDGKPSWVLICEGEYDAMSVDQAMDGKYPVVSIPAGVDSAKDAVKGNLEWLLTFDRVIFGFDQDQPGRDAMDECVKLLPPGRAYIARWPEKDPNELLKLDRSAEITRIVWNPTPYRPDGVVDARELTAECLGDVQVGIPWPHKFMTDWTYGRRWGETYTFGSGTGMGKSDELAEVAAATICGVSKYGEEFPPEAVALFNYEAGAATTKKTIAGKIGKRRFHIPRETITDGFAWTPEELTEVMARMDGPIWDAGGRLYINDSRGSAAWEDIKTRCRFLRQNHDVRHFIIDPLGALVAGEDDERKALDSIVLEASALAVELDACFYLVSHLTRPAMGPSHEEGGQVRLSQFRGSNGIGMYSNFVFGMERNQQAETDEERCETTFRVVKDRFTGNSTGKTSKTHYNRFNGSLDEPAGKGEEVI